MQSSLGLGKTSFPCFFFTFGPSCPIPNPISEVSLFTSVTGHTAEPETGNPSTCHKPTGDKYDRRSRHARRGRRTGVCGRADGDIGGRLPRASGTSEQGQPGSGPGK
ncbi:hypothetical protein LZ32DRAFT_309968 [Colletotrichum eremochloae]|nr:hypothetical protein LZ32DRAFT_309968 [Colletotrichum eremochloae]